MVAGRFKGLFMIMSRIAAFAVLLGLILVPGVVAASPEGEASQTKEQPATMTSKPEAPAAPGKSGSAAAAPGKPEPTAAKPDKPIPDLFDAGGVSTDKAVSGLAEQMARKSAGKDDKRAGPANAAERDAKASDASTDSVLEFHPAAPGDMGAIDPLVFDPRDSKMPAAKRIHGDVYGGLDANRAGTHAAGGSVGATSKGGKASVYVETDHVRTQTGSPPHQ
jgi:hypothetical protein